MLRDSGFCLNILGILIELLKQGVNPVQFRPHVLAHFLWPVTPPSILLCAPQGSVCKVGAAFDSHGYGSAPSPVLIAGGLTHVQLGVSPGFTYRFTGSFLQLPPLRDLLHMPHVPMF